MKAQYTPEEQKAIRRGWNPQKTSLSAHEYLAVISGEDIPYDTPSLEQNYEQ